jgi:hypothetical protein
MHGGNPQMRSRAGENLTAFLMFAVLLTVPLLAVFGIPEFVPASNPLSEQDQAFDEINFRSSTSPAIGEADSFSLSARPDIFASVRDASSDTPQRHLSQTVSHTEHIQNPFLQLEETDHIFEKQTAGPIKITSTDALVGWELSNTQTASRNGSSASQTGRNDSQKSPLTWRSAVRRLNELGIRQFRLEPGSREQEFHFSCSLTSRNNSRVTHRFEAEAADPLQAVEHVLQQITQW